MTIKEDKKPKRPHQAFLRLEHPPSRLDTSYAFAVKESGKGKVEIVSWLSYGIKQFWEAYTTVQTQKDLPTQFLISDEPLSASLVIGSFGSTRAYHSHAFDLTLERDPSSPVSPQEKPLRYGKLPEIHHKFKTDPTSPPIIITLVFTAGVIVALPILLSTVSFHITRI